MPLPEEQVTEPTEPELPATEPVPEVPANDDEAQPTEEEPANSQDKAVDQSPHQPSIKERKTILYKWRNWLKDKATEILTEPDE